MIRRIGLGSLTAIAIAALAAAMAQQDPWVAEKKDPKFKDVDWTFKESIDNQFIAAVIGMGPALYGKYCVSCHGDTGNGQGPLSPMLIPPPRDFTKGIFKGRSSHPELPPTATDLMRSLIHGIPLSSMLSYSFIGTPQQAALIGHVRDLAAGHFARGFGQPLRSGNFHRDAGMPFPTVETIARGKALYDRFNCVACHGEKGDGQGRVSDTLTDTRVESGGHEFDRPSSVRDFTQGVYSGGPNVRHMYLRVSGGIQGTVMPPFATSASTEDRWALTHYVMSLSKRSEPLPLPHSEVMVVKKVETLPALPGDPAWADMKKWSLPSMRPGPFNYAIQPVYVLDLYFQQLRHNRKRPYFTEANVRALHDGKDIAIRIEWHDAEKHADDQMELQFTTSNPPGFVLYGSIDDPVNLWRWKSGASGPAEIDAKGHTDMVPQAAPPTIAANAAYDAATKKWAVVFVRSIAGGGGGDVPLSMIPDSLNPFLTLMKDGGEAWPEGTLAIKVDPEDDPADAAEKAAKEAARKAMEAGIKATFGELPRHLTTWHYMQLEP
jgi:DMSO reductase family type II enzyme heme b subunit